MSRVAVFVFVFVLMKRTWGLDVLTGPTCSGCSARMELISAIEDERIAARILAHMASGRGHLPVADPGDGTESSMRTDGRDALAGCHFQPRRARLGDAPSSDGRDALARPHFQRRYSPGVTAESMVADPQ